ncbi:MAG: VOC family protein [Pseudonocardia sp.]
MTVIASLALVVLDCRDPHTVARFYSGVTGTEIERADDDWVQLRYISTRPGTRSAWFARDEGQPGVQDRT